MTKNKSAKTIAVLGLAAGFGLAALPLGVYATQPQDSDTTTVSATVNPVLSLRGTTDENEVNMTAGSTNNSLSTLLEATCNVLSGYTITASILTGGSTALVNTTDNSYTIASYTSATALSSAAGWGLAVSGTETTGSSFPLLSSNTYMGLGVTHTDPGTGDPVDDNIVANTGALTTGVTYRDTTVTYGIATPDTAAAGIYAGGVTYTIATN